MFILNKIISILFASALLLMPLWVNAKTTRYVSDDLEITMRNGQGTKFSIKKMLDSGTKLEVIETDPAGYSKVKTMDGVEGWVLTRYLSNTPSARERLAAAEQRLANVELELTKAKEELATLGRQNADTGSQNLGLKETAQRLQKELDDLRRTASNAVALDNENRQLKEKLQQLDHQNQSVVLENNALRDSDTKSWFLIGAAVLFGGIILGLILPRLRVRRSNSWGNL
jgi:SH3 domain protein